MRAPLLLLFLSLSIASFSQTREENIDSLNSLAEVREFQQMADFAMKLYEEDGNELVYLRTAAYAYLSMGDSEKSRELLRTSLEVDPNCLKCKWLFAIRLAEVDLDSALNIVNSLTVDYPDSLVYHTAKFEILYDSQQFAQLLESTNEVLSRFPESGEIYYIRYMARKAQGMNSLARRELRKGLEMDPNNRRLLEYIANEEFRSGNITAAKSYAEQALVHHPTSYEASSTLGEIYRNEGRSLEALDLYLQVEEHVPADNAAYYANRSMFYYDLENMNAACADAQMALSIVNRFPHRDTDSGIRTYAQNLVDEICDSTDASYYFQRGIARFNLGDYTGAMELYEKALEVSPGNLVIKYFQVNVLTAQDQYGVALRLIDEVLAHPMTDLEQSLVTTLQGSDINRAPILTVELHNSKAACHWAMGQMASAKISVETSLQLYDSLNIDLPVMKSTALLITAKIKMATGEYTSALREINQAGQLVPEDHGPHLAKLKWLLYPYGDAFVHFGPEDPEILGETYGSKEFDAEDQSTRIILREALNECNAILEINERAPEVVYYSGILKYHLGLPNYCEDLRNAYYGFNLIEALDAMNALCP